MNAQEAEPGMSAPQEGPPSSLRKAVVRGLILLAVLLAGVFLIHRLGLVEAANLRRASEKLDSLGVAAPFLFMLVVTLLVAAGCPRLIFCPIAGMAFGFWKGLLWCEIATVAGLYLSFLFIRWAGRGLVERRFSRIAGVARAAGNVGAPGVFLIRQLPVAGLFINILLALMPLRHRDFLAGTVLGTLPEAVPVTLIGAGVASGAAHRSALYVTVAVALLVAVWALIAWWIRSSGSRLARRAEEALRDMR
jgi:uncharacterized membrane protein YdjX (TVP38/TMEM64 family)